MRFRNTLLILIGIFILSGIFICIEPSITGLVIQDRFLISDVSVSADKFDQEIKVEQFDDYEIKFDNALYYFSIKPEYEQSINYILIEFIVDSSQIRDYSKEEVSLYFYQDGWLNLDIEFIKQDGRFYYYKGKAEKFGLFVVAPREKVEVPIVTPEVSKDTLLLFGLLPIFIIILLFSLISYNSVKLVQKINYRTYLLAKKGFVGLSKFVLSFGIVILILGILSKESGEVANIDLIYYAVIPLIILSLFSDIVLNLVLWLHRLILGNKLYRFVRNSFWLFAFVLISMFILLYKFVPDIQGSLNNFEILIYGLIPLVVISFGFVFVFYLFYVSVRKIVHVI